MIQWFDDKVFKSKFLLIFIMLLIALPLIMWRLAGQFQSSANGTVLAKINDLPVYSNDFQNTVRQVRERLKPLADINPDMVTDELVEKQAMDELVSRVLVGQFAEANGMRISDEQVAEQIATMRDFMQDGSFNQKLYLETLQNARFTPKQFENRVRGLRVIDQLQEALMETEFALPQEQRRLLALVGETRDIGYLKLSIEHSDNEQKTFSDEDIQAYYDEHKSNFATPEAASFEYLELERDAMAAQVDVTEEAIQAAYESRLNEFSTPTEWKARHILLEIPEGADKETVAKVEQQADDLVSRISNGASFADLAKKFSDDPGSAEQGGDLGFFGKGMMVPPFEEAVSALELNEVSAPVRTRFGLHIIQLLDKKGGRAKPLSEVREKIVADLQSTEVENLFYDRQELLGTLTFENPGTLDPAAESLGIEIKDTALMPRIGGIGIFKESKVLDAAFSDEVLRDRNNSAVIEVEDGHAVALRVKEYRPASTQPLQEVKERIIRSLQHDAAVRRMEAQGKEIRDAILAGEAAEGVAKRYHADWQRLGTIDRNNSVLGPELQEMAFSLLLTDNLEDAVQGTILRDGSYALLQLFNVYPGKSDEENGVSQAERIKGSYARAEIEALIASLKAHAEIVYAEKKE